MPSRDGRAGKALLEGSASGYHLHPPHSPRMCPSTDCCWGSPAMLPRKLFSFFFLVLFA